MKLIAHACGPTLYPSNRILSAREALKNDADLVELDVQLTADNKLAVFHDRDLTKKFGRPERCCEITAEEFTALRRVENPSVPGDLLEDFFQAEVAPILIHHGHAAAEALLDLVAEYNYQDKVVFGIKELASASVIRQRFPQAKIFGFIPDPEDIEAFAENGANFIRLWQRWVNPDTAKRVKSSGAELIIMTGGTGTDCRVGRPNRDCLKNAISWEPDGLLVNDIAFVRAIIAELP